MPFFFFLPCIYCSVNLDLCTDILSFDPQLEKFHKSHTRCWKILTSKIIVPSLRFFNAKSILNFSCRVFSNEIDLAFLVASHFIFWLFFFFCSAHKLNSTMIRCVSAEITQVLQQIAMRVVDYIEVCVWFLKYLYLIVRLLQKTNISRMKTCLIVKMISWFKWLISNLFHFFF